MTTSQDTAAARGRRIATVVLVTFGVVMVGTMLWVVMTVLDAIL